MQLTNTIVGLVAVGAAVVQAQNTIEVTVGSGGKLVYSPNDITANVGDMVEFSFFPKNHTVSQSSFKDPCHPLEGGFFSGFVPTSNSPSGSTFTITVKDTKPIWIYCGQTKGNHCQSGMVAAINAPTTGNTLAAFQALAANATTSTTPATGPVGGVLYLSPNNTSSSTGSVTSMTASATSAPSAAAGTSTSSTTSTSTAKPSSGAAIIGASALTCGAALVAAMAML